MNALQSRKPNYALTLPTMIEDAGEPAARRFLEFFTVNIRNTNTRTAYGRAVSAFMQWCQDHGINRLQDVQPIHVAAYIEQLQGERSAPTPPKKPANSSPPWTCRASLASGTAQSSRS
jgi:hypothetical protein